MSGEPARTTHDWPPIVIATAIFAALSLWMAAASPGFLEADACTHYQYARFALGETHYLVNVWGRPFVTALYAIPATYFYNHFTNRVKHLSAEMDDFSLEFLNIAERNFT